MVRLESGSTLIMQAKFLVGILTERDVFRAVASGEDLTKEPVSAWMTREPQSVAPDTAVEEAAQIMRRNGFRHLPADGRHVRGVVSLRDLFAARIRRPPAPACPNADEQNTHYGVIATRIARDRRAECI